MRQTYLLELFRRYRSVKVGCEITEIHIPPPKKMKKQKEKNMIPKTYKEETDLFSPLWIYNFLLGGIPSLIACTTDFWNRNIVVIGESKKKGIFPSKIWVEFNQLAKDLATYTNKQG